MIDTFNIPVSNLLIYLLVICVAECDFSLVDIEGRTALHWTISNPDASCIHALVDSYPPLLNRKYGNRVCNHCIILHVE